jgi:L-aspartate oxidase
MTNYDVLIIGSGVAGLTTAIKLAEAGKNVAIATRQSKPRYTNTYWAQGGIIYSDRNKDYLDLIHDIDQASSNTCNLEAAKVLAERSGEILEEILLEKVKTPFAKDESGSLKYTKEAAHSTERIIYQGDHTGKEIEVSLLNYLWDKERFPNVTFLQSHTAIDLITPNHHGVTIRQRYEENRILGAYLFDRESGDVKKVLAKMTVLATGGIGGLYLHHSNTDGARGDGHAMAYRAGAQMMNMEFIQFHPTTFYHRSTHRRFLISEALRGEGGILRNSQGEAFMERYHNDKELAPRDIVSRAIWSELIRLKDDSVFLDMTHLDSSWLQERFPSIYEYCLEKGVDITKDMIPVVPAAHYTCGGVKTDLQGRTTLKNLYAVGEVACNGLHGANRLASTSLLEGLTFGYMAAENILRNILLIEDYPESKISNWTQAKEETDLALVEQDWQTLKQTMWNYLGIIRSRNRLGRARAILRELYSQVSKFYKHAKLHDELIGLRNSVEVAYMVQKASDLNKTSVGCFYRIDD